ncbi:hypothetical protein IJG76_00685 [Candidatus Saccharibacteria bacterium]|nr:hypothetical protein [Candidatus Saccharibacteria bacterium]
MDQNQKTINQAVIDSVNLIEQSREREIIARRFGLKEKRETLEEIGEFLSITRERVRQLEKAITIRLRLAAEDNDIPALVSAEKLIVRNLTELGRVATVEKLGEKIFDRPAKREELASLIFIASISSTLTYLSDSDSYYSAIGIAEYGDEKKLKERIDEIVKLIRSNKKPMSISELDNALNYEHPDHIRAIASISKSLSSLNDNWGLISWPSVNPKNIRDKIYVVLEDNGKPMHFKEIANSIRASKLRRSNVTEQAIHNELIKDERFILIGRGIYALKSWGYEPGTVKDIIIRTMKAENAPLTREQIVKAVLKARNVKETTVLLSLQDKKTFKKLDKNSYTLA